MHAAMYIEQLGSGRYAVSFTIHHGKDSEPLAVSVELEQAFPNRLNALWALSRVGVAHMGERYGLRSSDFTVAER
jgi:hypothetical protein